MSHLENPEFDQTARYSQYPSAEKRVEYIGNILDPHLAVERFKTILAKVGEVVSKVI